MNVLEVSGLKKAFKNHVAVDGVSFAAGPGELVGLIGPNGAGKSTTVKILTGQLLADEGTVAIGGEDIAKDPVAAKRALNQVRQDKRREVGDGFDGSWVAHPGLVETCREVFDQWLGDER